MEPFTGSPAMKRDNLRRFGVLISFYVGLTGCASSSHGDSNPDVTAALAQAAAQRERSDQEWDNARQGFAQAASLDRFMTQHSSSTEDAKAWALVADTHEEWASDDLDGFVSTFQKSCVPSVTEAFDHAGSRMIQYGQRMAGSTDPHAAKLSPKLVDYGSDIANLKSLCEKTAEQIKEAEEAEKSAVPPPSYDSAAPQPASSDHPYAKAAGEILGLTLATALVGGLVVLDYAAARNAAAPTVVQPAPMHCTSYQLGMYTNTNCY